ncbi:helicase protein MOM1-like isoform X2 [Rhododendron vialii]|uniref:helicase protein MOM1-like isoform X2 n=1 Tax=Rhododendron vialii TaxID=182163 RepID=UPI00265F7324|nr:helicase protein MOM1-like isoform X2 [Rhododendron vialii]
MANDTRSSRGSKDDENNSSIKKPVSIKESSTSGSSMMDTSGFRKSIREMPLQKQTSSSPSTRSGSEHLDRPTPTTFAVKRKSDIVEKQRMPSPSRTSDRGKEHASLGCSGTMRSEKGSGSPDDRRKKLKSEESVKQLVRDSMETSRREKISPHTNGRTYKSLIKQKRRRDTDPDFSEELKRPEAISKIDSSYCGGSVSKPVDDREDGGENLTSRVDAAAPPLSKCKRDNISGTHVPCSERLRGQRCRNNPEVGNHELGKKCDKVVNDSADPASSRPRLREGPGDERGDSGVPVNKVSQLLPRSDSTDSITHTLHTSHASASSFPSKVSSSLPEVHMVNSEEETGLSDMQKTFHVLLNPEIPELCEILQLSCWIAASLRECEIDKKASLALAKQHLNFGCTEEEANHMHSKLRLVKKRFKVAVHDFASDRLISKQEQVPNCEKKKKELSKSIKRMEKKRDKKIMKLSLKHQEEIQELNKPWEEDSAKLKKDCMVDLAIIRSIHSNDPVRSEKLKRREEKCAKELEELEHRKGILLGKLEADYLAEMNRVRRKAEISLQDLKSWAQSELYGAPSSEAAAQCVPDEVVVGEFVEILRPDVESNREPDQIEDLDVSVLDPLAIQNDAAVSPTNVGSLEESSLCQPVNTLAQAGSSTQILALHGERSQASNSTVMHDGDAQASDNQDVLLRVEVVPLHSTGDGLTYQTNDDEAFIEQVEQLQVSNSTEMHGDAEASANQDLLLQVEDQTNNEEALPEHVEQLQSSKFTEIHVGDAEVSAASGVEQLPCEGLGASQPFENESEASENVDLPQQVEVVSLHSADNGSSDQTNTDEALLELVEQLRTSKSTEIHVGDAEAGENQDGLHEVEVVPCHLADAGPAVQTDREALIEGVQQLQMSPSSDSPVDHNHPGSRAASGVEQLHSEGLRASQPFESETEASENQKVPRQVEVVPLHSMDNGLTDQTHNREALLEHLEHDGDEEARANQHSPLQVEVVPFHPVDTRPNVQTNHEEALEGVQQPQMSSFSDSLVDRNQPDVLSDSGVEQLPSEGRGASQPFENESEALDPLGIQSGEILELPPPNTDGTLGPHLQLAVENDHQPSSQGFMPSQDAEASSQPVEDTAWVPNQAVSLTDLGMHPPLEGLGTHLPLNSAPQMASQMLTQPFYGDPLLKELDRVHKEKEKTIKIHEEAKLGLKFEHDKELQEAIAVLRRKYDDKFHDVESAFLLKKKELDSNTKMVLMNKILADAFQSKCYALLRSQQGVPSNVMPQHIPSSRPAHGPSRVTGSASVPFVRHSSPPCSTTPARPPLIVPITPPTGNLRASGEIRAPAPHLQRFRPSSSMPSTSISSVVPQGMLPIQQVQINLPTASASVPHVRTTSPSVPHVPMTSPLIHHPPSRYDCGRQAEVSGRTRERLFDDNNQPGGLPSLLPPLNFRALDLSQFVSRVNGRGGVAANVAGSGIATDVVCLSDDD